MIVLTAGTFDLFHIGHLRLIKWCKRIAGKGQVVVSVNRDEFIERFKGKRPALDTVERIYFIKQLNLVNKVVENIGDEDFRRTIEFLARDGIKVDLIVIGSDWHSKDYLKQLNLDWEYLTRHKIGICYVPFTPGISSTDIKNRINIERDV